MQQELAGCEFRDERLGKRFSMVLRQLSEGTAESIPLACQDWANAKAAYRFFSNERVSEADILSGHFRSTRERFAGTGGTVLVLHDTTVFSYMRENVGMLHKPKHGPSDRWRQQNPLCGISMHSSLAITEAGLPLGLAAVKFWTRKEFKGIQRAEAEDQSDARAHRREGECPLGRKLGRYHGRFGRPGPVCSYRRSRSRHL